MNIRMNRSLLLSIFALVPVTALAQDVPLRQDSYFTPASAINFSTTTTINVRGPTGSQALNADSIFRLFRPARQQPTSQKRFSLCLSTSQPQQVMSISRLSTAPGRSWGSTVRTIR